MRCVICALVVLGFAPPAFAGDFDILRGSEPTYHWGGFYGGGQIGYSSAVVDFSQAAAPQIAFILRDTAIEQDEQISKWSVLGSRSTTGTSLGDFAGYNFEWEDVILGLELNYNHVSLSASAANSMTRSFTDSTNLPAGHNYLYTMTVGSASSLQMTDIATFRARAGWEAGNFLPYAFAGLAVGRGDFSTSTSVFYTAVDFTPVQTPPIPPLPTLTVGPATQADGQNPAFAYGFAAGLGTDIALTSHVFVRGEVEYIFFAPLDHIQVSVTSARVGAGFKF